MVKISAGFKFVIPTMICAVDGDLCTLFPPSFPAHHEGFLWNAEDGYYGYRDADSGSLPMIYLMPEEALELSSRLPLTFRPAPPTPERRRLCAYRHFRALGFIVRDGVGYGVDFMLYRQPPGQSHALHGLLILSASLDPSASPPASTTVHEDGMSWRTLHGLARCIFSTKKTLVVAVYDTAADAIVSTQLVTRFLANQH